MDRRDVGQAITGGGFTVRPDQDAGAAEPRAGGETRLVGEIVAEEQRAMPGERRARHQRGDRRALVVAGQAQLDHHFAVLNVERVLAREILDQHMRLAFDFGDEAIMHADAERLLLDHHAVAPAEPIGEQIECGIERGGALRPFDRAAGEARLGTVAADHAECRTVAGEKAIERRDRTPADQRHAPAELRADTGEQPPERGIDGDGIGTVGKLHQRAVEIEEQARAVNQRGGRRREVASVGHCGLHNGWHDAVNPLRQTLLHCTRYASVPRRLLCPRIGLDRHVMIDDDKRLAAEAAVAEIEDGMLVGLGSGSTAAFAIAAIGKRVSEGLEIDAVVTSLESGRLAARHGIELLDFEDVATVDLVIDGTDEIDPAFRAIKGAGGAMMREKIVANAAKRMVVVADGRKRVARLGGVPVPVEVLPFARSAVLGELRRLGAEPVLRRAGDDPYLTDQDNIVFDCAFAALDMPDELAVALSTIPGVLAHGLFLREVDAAYIATGGRVDRLERH